ncbi:hypothetical protein B9Z55_012902 [Caenorhabditis nigoni]|uniref:F-box domain-containing protein n=1 Tax=Caenorhabditis nigoni TaxID=1611254 RepID=A0A2G5TZC3_9PELO|nr:hypothetical protein B9Z55_012902 [Caenorhabditis nigoni]
MTENLSNDPIYNTNWCDVPKEIKLKCIKTMEFKERLSLRCTAKTERSLVDSQKIKIFCGRFYMSHFQLNFLPIESMFRSFKNSDEAVEFTNYILKIGVFRFIDFHYHDLEAMNFTEQISAECISFHSSENKTVVDVLQKLKAGVKSIMINAKEGINDYAFDEILAISHMWINEDSEIGTIFQLSRTYQGPRPSEFQRIFLEHFTDHIVSNTGKRIRIRTNNPDHHILLERGLDYNFDDDDEREVCCDQFFRLIVISAEMKESEYDDKCMKWICVIDSENYSDYDDDPDAYVNEYLENIENDDQVENGELNPNVEDDDDW